MVGVHCAPRNSNETGKKIACISDVEGSCSFLATLYLDDRYGPLVKEQAHMAEQRLGTFEITKIHHSARVVQDLASNTTIRISRYHCFHLLLHVL
jgi:hypothetical protein